MNKKIFALIFKLKPLVVLGYVIFLFQFILSIYFYQERTLFCDMAYHTFKIIVYKKLLLDHFRFGAAITQIVPLILCCLKVSLKYILLIYSSWYIIYYGIVFSILVFVFKNPMLGFCQIGYYVLFSSDSFYWMQSELQQGISFVFFSIGFIIFYEHKPHRNRLLQFLIYSLLITICIFFHPLVIIPFTFLIVYYFVFKKKIKPHSFVLIGFILLSCIATKKYFFMNWYDEAASSLFFNKLNLILFDLSINSIPNSLALFFHYSFIDYFPLYLFSMLVFVKMIFSRLFGEIGFILLCLVGTLTVITIGNLAGGQKFYFDNMYLLLSIVLLVPIFENLCFDNVVANKLWLLALLSFVAIRLVMVYNAHSQYTQRLNWLKDKITYCRQTHIDKAFITAHKENAHLLMTWALAYESILCSSLDNKSSISFIIPTQQSLLDSIIQNNTIKSRAALHLLYADYETISLEQLPNNYFNMAHTPYHVIDDN